MIGAVAVAGMFIYYWTDLSEAENFAEPEDLTFVVNWGDIGDQCRIVAVRNSYRSSRALGGDHCDVYCFTIDEFPEEFVRTDRWASEHWMRGPVDDPILKEAISIACGMAEGHKQSWFPAAEEVNSERYYLSFVAFGAHDLMVDRVQLTAYDTRHQVMYYADVSW